MCMQNVFALVPETPLVPSINHAENMFDRIVSQGTKFLADSELLEIFLSPVCPGEGMKSLTGKLIGRFGSFARAIAAPSNELLPALGRNKMATTTLLSIREAAERMGKSEIISRKIIDNWEKVIAYLNTVMAYCRIEEVRVLFLDSKNRLISDELQGSGTVDRVFIYPREVIRRALDLNSTALIIVHNHPSGDPTPSQDDIDVTYSIKIAAEALGIVLHDHIIIGSGGWSSLRKLHII